MSLFNLTGSVQQTLRNFGLGDSWNLAECKYVAPDGATGDSKGDLSPLGFLTNNTLSEEAQRTITFLDVNPIANLDLSLFPTVELAKSFLVEYLTKSNADSAGRKVLLDNQTMLRNNIITYQLPSGAELPRTWGNKASKFNVKTLVCGSNYLDKVKRLAQLFSYNSDLQGGTFYHPYLGTFENTHVSDITILENSQVYNGSIISISFITSNVFTSVEDTGTPLATQILSAILEVNGVLQSLPTATNFLNRLEGGFDPLIRSFGTKGAVVADNNLSINFDSVDFDNPNISNDISGGVKVDVTQNLPDLENALNSLRGNGLDLDFNLDEQVQIVFDNLCVFAGVNVDGYGNGFISSSSETTYEEVLTIANLIYSETTTDREGNEVIINRDIESYTDGIYKVKVVTTVNKRITTPNDINTIRGQINDIIVYLSVLDSLSPENILPFSDIISNLELTFNAVKNSVVNSFVVERDTSILALAELYNVSVDEILKNNPQLIAHRPLQKGMEINI